MKTTTTLHSLRQENPCVFFFFFCTLLGRRYSRKKSNTEGLQSHSWDRDTYFCVFWDVLLAVQMHGSASVFSTVGLPFLLQNKRVEQFRAAHCSYTSFGSPGCATGQRTWVLLSLVTEQPLATARSIMVKPLGWA